MVMAVQPVPGIRTKKTRRTRNHRLRRLHRLRQERESTTKSTKERVTRSFFFVSFVVSLFFLRVLSAPAFLRCCVIGGCFLSCCAAALHAEPSYQVEYGFRGIARGECPMPVQVFLQGDNVDRQLLVRITGTPMVYLPVELPRETRKHLFVYTEPATSRLPGGFPSLEILEGRRRIHEETLVTRAP